MDEDVRIRIENVRNAVVEAANGADPELLDDLVAAGDLPADLEDRLQDIEMRWPRMMLSAADLDGLPVAAVWLPDEGDQYVPVGHLEFTIDGEPQVAVVDGVAETLVTERPESDHAASWESTSMMDRGEPSTS